MGNAHLSVLTKPIMDFIKNNVLTIDYNHNGFCYEQLYVLTMNIV
jgi:hypothetical protein